MQELEQAIRESGLWEEYGIKSIAEIYGVCRRENSHTSFIQWFLYADYLSSERDLPLKILLKVIVSRAFQQITYYKGEMNPLSHIKQEVYERLKTPESYSIKGDFSIKTEVTGISEFKYRIDLEIDCALLLDGKEERLFVELENKVLTKSGKNQKQYYDHFRQGKEYSNYLCTYLSPISSSELDEYPKSKCGYINFIQICYQDLLDELFIPIGKKLKKTCRTRVIIDDYIKNLSVPTFYEKEGKRTIMAITEAQKKKMLKIYKKHRDKINDILSNVCSGVDSKFMEEDLKPFWNMNGNLLTAIAYVASIDKSIEERYELKDFLKKHFSFL